MGSGGQQDDPRAGYTAAPTQPHVLVFPFPALGHITPMLQLAEVLSLAGIRVTFLCTHHYYRRLLLSAGVEKRLARRPDLRLLSIPDGLPEDHPRNTDGVMEMLDSISATAPPLFREILSSPGGAEGRDGARPLTCVVADGLLIFAVDIAGEMGVPIIAFRTSSACSFWAYYCIPKLIAAGMIPFPDGCELDELVAYVPGMESFLRRRDLPSFCRAKEITDARLQFANLMTQRTTRYWGLVFNTPEFAEASALAHIRTQLTLTYPVGPLHGLLETLESNTTAEVSGGASSSSDFAGLQERDCMGWLDTKPPASVVYVSFGSLILLTSGQLLEFWHGLLNSGYHFLWVLRPGLVAGEGSGHGGGGGVPEEVAEATRERGFLVGWAPQQEVLAHPAVGCFLTHSGWNSTLESMWAGVPMMCWPSFADQPVNSRFVGEVWGTGLDMKDNYDRAVVEKAVREVMAGEGLGRKIRGAAAAMAKKMRESVAEGGASCVNLQRLICDIKAMSLTRLDQ